MRLLLPSLLVLALGGAALYDAQRAYWNGPASDHFDGLRFFNPEGTISKGLFDVLKWRLAGGQAEWPQSVPAPLPTARPPRRVEGGALRATFVGHASVLVQTAGLNILTDPIWAERASPLGWLGPRRMTPPGIAFEDLPPIDLVLVSHSHYDHMDLPTLARLREAHDPLFVAPLGNDHILHGADPKMRVATLDWWQAQALENGSKVHAVPVYHWSRRGAFDRNKALWSGFVVETAHGNIYFSGDTGFGRDGDYFREAARRFGGFRLAILPVGAYEPRWFMRAQHVNPAEAVQMHRLLRAEHSLGVHLRTFQLTDEALGQPEVELAQALAAQRVSPQGFFTLPIGGAWQAEPGS